MAAKEEAEAAATAAAARVTAAEHAMSTANEQAMAKVRAAEEATRHTAGAVVLGSALTSVWLSLISHASVCLSHALVSQHERSGRSHVQNERDFEISISPPTLARELYVCTFLKGSVSCE